MSEHKWRNHNVSLGIPYARRCTLCGEVQAQPRKTVCSGSFAVTALAEGFGRRAQQLAQRLAGRKPSAPDETAWLIEFSAKVSSTPAYYGKTGEGNELGVTTDHAAAIRFARAQDAQAVIDESGWTEATPVEHAWCHP